MNKKRSDPGNILIQTPPLPNPPPPPKLILAGAGNGKTTTITARIVYMVEKENIAPSQILALTFYKKPQGTCRQMRIDIKFNPASGGVSPGSGVATPAPFR
jgi:DNA helicase-2/ATP-dependent DNA helicase PcrA